MMTVVTLELLCTGPGSTRPIASSRDEPRMDEIESAFTVSV